MTETDIKNKNLVLIDFLRSFITNYKIKPEYSTNDKDKEVIVVQEESGEKAVLYDGTRLYNYYNVNIYGTNIQSAKDVSVEIGNLIGDNKYFDWKNQKWQIMIKQFSNPRTLYWEDIRRVSYTLTLQCIVNRIS
jgi:hypothetical protein